MYKVRFLASCPDVWPEPRLIVEYDIKKKEDAEWLSVEYREIMQRQHDRDEHIFDIISQVVEV